MSVFLFFTEAFCPSTDIFISNKSFYTQYANLNYNIKTMIKIWTIAMKMWGRSHSTYLYLTIVVRKHVAKKEISIENIFWFCLAELKLYETSFGAKHHHKLILVYFQSSSTIRLQRRKHIIQDLLIQK